MSARDLGSGVLHLPLTPLSGINAYHADGVLFDAGTRQSAKSILRALAGRDLDAHALTHAHPDHQGASHAVCTARGAPFWVGDADADVAEGTAPTSIPDHWVNGLIGAVWTGPPHPVDRRLTEGDTVGRFVVLETPGHSDGHVVFWDDRDGILILGDVLRNLSYATLRPGLREPPTAFTPDPGQNRTSARRLVGLRPRLVLFGHGPPLRDPDAFDAFLRALPT